MNSSFDKLLHFLNQKNISLAEYLDYLSYLDTKKYFKLTEYLRQRDVDLLHFKSFLTEQVDQLSTLGDSENKNLQQIKNFGFFLLETGRFELKELNELFCENSISSLKLRTLLQKLLKCRKITIDEFIEWQNFQWENVEDSPYHIKATDQGFEFYVRNEATVKKFGHYEILEELGRGGMGIVYKAYHSNLKQYFALKILIAGEDATEKMLQRFHREVQTMAKLNHHGIVQIIDSGQEGGEHYFAMEYVEGVSLKEQLEKKISKRKCLIWIRDVLNSLHYTHEQGVLHRDLKLENIYLSKSGEPKIGDFGLAKDRTETQNLTQTGTILGTPVYMSPEQAAGENFFDCRSDVYSIGVCLYQLLTQKLPFESPDFHILLHKIQYVDPKPPSKLKASIHPDLDTIILKAIEKEPAKRYQSAKEFAEDLTRFLDGKMIQAKGMTLLEKGIRWGKRNVKSLLFVSVLLSLLCCFLLFAKWTYYREQTQEVDALYQMAREKRKIPLRGNSFEARTQKLQELLGALNILNKALNYSYHQSKIEREKWDIGKAIVLLACESKSYLLANYIAGEMEGLTRIRGNKKEDLNQLIQLERDKVSKKNEQRFQEWLELLQTRMLTKEQQRDAVFEISKMTEDKIFLQLLELLEKGTSYFLQHSQNRDTQDQLYNTTAAALGRLENIKASELLKSSLTKMAKKMGEIPMGKRPFKTMNYMIILAQALANLNNSHHALFLYDLRPVMGYDSLFWDRVEPYYKKLLRNPVFFQKLKLSEKNPQTHFYEGVLKEDLEQYEEAIQSFSKAIQLKPEFPRAFAKRGFAKFKLGRHQEALLDFTKAIQLDPKASTTFHDRGVARHARRDMKGSIEDYSEAIRLNPNYVSALNNRGVVRKDLRDYNGAIQDFTKVIQLNPQYSHAFNNRGNAHFLNGDIKKALSDYEEAIRLNPDFGVAYCNRGNIRLQYNNIEGAIEDYNNSIRLKPKYSLAHVNRGIAKLEQKDFAGALQDLNYGLVLEPNFPIAYYYRGTIFLQRNQRKRAEKEFKIFLVLGQNNHRFKPLFLKIYKDFPQLKAIKK